MERDLTKGSVIKVLLRFSLPFLFSSFLQTFYGMVDLYVIGRYNGAAAISAVSVGSQVMHMLTLIIVGLAMGSTVSLGVAIGSRDQKRAGRIVGNTITFFVFGAIVLMIITLLAVDGIISVMSVPEEAVMQTKTYLTICFAGIPFITAYNVISCVYRGMGDSNSPMIFVGVACVFNILIDFVLIGGFQMGAAGAAFGTVVSQAISVAFALLFLRKKKFGLEISRKDLVPESGILKEMLKVGAPVAAQDGFVQIAFLAITMIANTRGVNVAAAVGIVEKIISFLFLVPSAMLSSVSAVAAQDRGAGKDKRARQTLIYAILICVSFGLLCSVVCQIIPGQVVGAFTHERAVRTLGSQYLRSYVFDCMIAGIHFCFTGFFAAYGLSGFSFLYNSLSVVLVRIPGAYLATRLYPNTLFPMGIAAPLGSILSSILCVILFAANQRKFGILPKKGAGGELED